MKQNILNTKQIGDLGESVAVKYLQNKGFTIIQRNYWRKWGEIDILTEKQAVLHCIEVKTVSYETKRELEYALLHETWRPEEQVHKHKLHQVERVLNTWISENDYKNEFQIDVVAVRIVPRETYAIVNLIEHEA